LWSTLSKGTNGVDVTVPSLEENRVFSSYLEFLTMDKGHKQSDFEKKYAFSLFYVNQFYPFGSTGMWHPTKGPTYRSGGPGSIPGTTRKKKVVGLERGSLSLVSTTEELLDRKVAAPV
jgi:hypothetical protein